MLHFAIHGVSAILSKPSLAAKLLSETITWRGLTIANLSLHEELIACKLAAETRLGFDDGLHYYFAKHMGISIISFDKDFDSLDIKRFEPHEIIV
ncbi:MAG: PIN domain-containing protein [Candidatus Methanomethylicia archaeon]